MRAKFVLLSLCVLTVASMRLSYAAAPSAEGLRGTIRDYIAAQEKLQGVFVILDERSQETRQLELVRVHERVGKTGDYYFSCTDMTDVRTGEQLDLDFDIEETEGNLKVVDIRIHKDDGIPRYTYGAKDQRVPLPIATLQPTQEGSELSGKVSFMKTDEGLKINAVIVNAPPGKHGFHIHENGSCADEGKGAGGYFNPDGVAHGNLAIAGFQGAYAGDLGNIEIGQDGKGKFERVIAGLTLDVGKYAVSQRSVILHKKADNFEQSTETAGARIACGVIPQV